MKRKRKKKKRKKKRMVRKSVEVTVGIKREREMGRKEEDVKYERRKMRGIDQQLTSFK